MGHCSGERAGWDVLDGKSVLCRAAGQKHIHTQGQYAIPNSPTCMFPEVEETWRKTHSDTGKTCETPHRQ